MEASSRMKVLRLIAAAIACMSSSLSVSGQTLPAAPRFVALSGSLSPAVATAQDLGQMDSDFPMDHMLLQLKRSPAQEADVRATIADLQNPGSPSYHHWLTSKEFGDRFGADAAELQRVTDWLSQAGFQVNGISDARNLIDFSGTVRQVQAGFHVQMHHVMTATGDHITNMSAPEVPADLADFIEGVPLSDFKPHPMLVGLRTVRRDPTTGKIVTVALAPGTDPSLTTTYGNHQFELVTPGDFEQIYNLKPLWDAGYAGKGQTIAVVEDTLMNAPDVVSFRQQFGLSGYAGTFTQGNPVGSHPCGNPGINSNAIEASLDAEWAGATAPDADVYLAACQDTLTQFGGLLAVLNLLSQKTPPQTISMSYGQCEAELGAIQINQFSYAFQQAVAEGVGIFVSSGDEGPASCDANQAYAKHGVAASGFATTPYAVAVGGTDFLDEIQGTTPQYWSNTNTASYASALSYIPEKTWNDSCADSALLGYVGATEAYGAAGYCNNAGSYFLTTASGSGGPSQIFSKPSWQVFVAGNPADNARDIPDISLFSANGFWGHALVFCDSISRFGGSSCDYSVAGNAISDSAGGTSFAAPAMAGIFSLITQKYGRQGNPNVGLYALATQQYGTNSAPLTDTGCNASLGNQGDPTCIFHDVTAGSIDLPCVGSLNCYGSSKLVTPRGTRTYLGAMSTSSTNFEPTYPTTTGWDYATGLGSINAANLVNGWSAVLSKPAYPPVSGVAPPETPVGFLPLEDMLTYYTDRGITPAELAPPATPYDLVMKPIADKLLADLMKQHNSSVPLGLPGNQNSQSAVNFAGFQTVPIIPAAQSADQTPVQSGVTMDVNKDGKPDLVAIQVDGNINVLLNPGTGNLNDFKITSTNSTAVPLSTFFVSGFAADMNGDGYMDLVVTDLYNNAAFVYLNKKDGTFADPIETIFTFPKGLKFLNVGGGIVAMDTDGDGIPDLVASSHFSGFNATGNYTTVVLLIAKGIGNGSFAAPVEQDVQIQGAVSGSQGFSQMLVADMNKDGKPDLVFPFGVRDRTTKQTTIMMVGLGTGKGTFTNFPSTIPTTGAASTGVYSTEGSDAVADVNGDGNPDLIFSAGTSGIYVSLGNGDGTMQNPALVLNQPGTLRSGNAGTMQFVDVNNDGIVDAVSYGTGMTSVYLGLGNGNFGPGPLVQLTSGQAFSTQPAPADFNGDGKTDLVVLDQSSNMMGLFKGVNGSFAGPNVLAPAAQPAQNLRVVATGDFNGDGAQDVVAFRSYGVANAFQPELVLGLNDGKGNFTYNTIIPGPTLTSTNATASVEPFAVDFNGDGKLDLLIDQPLTAAGPSGPYLVLNNGDNTFGTPKIVSLGVSLACVPSYMDVGDINGDGKPDMVIAYGGDGSCVTGKKGNTPSGFFVLLNQGGGNFTPSFIPYGYGAYQPKLVDLNGDGKLDLVLSDSLGSQGFYYLYAIPGRGDGTFDNANAQLLLENTAVSTIVPGDFDGDGKADLAVGVIAQVDNNGNALFNTTGLYTMKGNGDFTFGLPVQYAPGMYPTDGKYVDLNGDGRPDLLLTETTFYAFTDIQQGNFVPLINLSSGGFAQGAPYFTSAAQSGRMFVADFNGDGAVDGLTSAFVFTVSSPDSAYVSELFLNQGGVNGTVKASGNAVTQFSPVTLTETLTPTIASTVPTGTVTFFDNGTALQTVPVTAGVATLVVDNLPVGADKITATYSGDSSYNPLKSSATVVVNVAALSPGFTLTAATPSSLTVRQGQTGSEQLTLSSNAAFNGVVTFTCAGAPSETSCSVSPQTVTMTAGQSFNPTVIVTTTPPNNTYQAQTKSPSWHGAAEGVALCSLLMLLPIRRRFKPVVWRTMSLLLAGVLISLGTVGCGGSGYKYPGSPVGTTNLTVTATSGTIVQAVTVTLTIAD